MSAPILRMHGNGNASEEAGDVEKTTCFTVLFEADVDPIEGGKDYHIELNNLFTLDRQHPDVFCAYGLQRCADPSLTSLQPSSTETGQQQSSPTSILAPNAVNDAAGDSESQTNSNSLLLPNVITKGIYTNIDIFGEISSDQDHTNLLSNHLWQKKLLSLPRMSMWHCLNGPYKYNTEHKKDGGPGTFFRIRKYYLKKGSPKHSVIDLLSYVASKIKTTNHLINRNDSESDASSNDSFTNGSKRRKIPHTGCTSFEILSSNDFDRRQELMDIASWTSMEEYVMDTKTDKAKISKIEKSISYHCVTIDTSFWMREEDGMHVPLKTKVNTNPCAMKTVGE